MNYNKFIDKVLKDSENELEDVEILISINEKLHIDTFHGEINKYEIAESGGVSLRGKYNDKMGYAYTEKIEYAEIANLIESVKSNSLYIDTNKEEIQPPSDSYKKVDKIKLDKNSKSIKEKIDFLLKLEKEILNYDDKVYESMAYYTEIKNSIFLANSKGVLLKDNSTVGILSASSYVKDNDETKTGHAYRYVYDFDIFNEYKKIAAECVNEALNKLGASPVKSGKYRILIKNDAFALLLNSFSSTFSAENVQKNLSLFKDKLGEKIGSEKITIIDNPFLSKGLGSSHFDSEGVATKYKEVIKDGVLKTFLHNTITAKTDGIKSTGNGYRSYKGSLKVAPTNLYLEKGKHEFKELKNYLDDGLIIYDLQGLHSGVNTVSGDFSLSASGSLVKKGKLERAVNQITIAGNLFELLEDIELIGNDLMFTPMAGGNIGSPSVLISELSVSGE